VNWLVRESSCRCFSLFEKSLTKDLFTPEACSGGRCCRRRNEVSQIKWCFAVQARMNSHAQLVRCQFADYIVNYSIQILIYSQVSQYPIVQAGDLDCFECPSVSNRILLKLLNVTLFLETTQQMPSAQHGDYGLTGIRTIQVCNVRVTSALNAAHK